MERGKARKPESLYCVSFETLEFWSVGRTSKSAQVKFNLRVSYNGYESYITAGFHPADEGSIPFTRSGLKYFGFDFTFSLFSLYLYL